MFDYNPPQNLLEKKTIMITGASDGIGRVCANFFADYGATVILVSRTQEKLEQVYDEIEAKHPGKVIIQPLDLRTAGSEDFKILANSIDEQFEALDGLIHNAALLGTRNPIEFYPEQEWQDLMQVNVNAAFMLTKALLPALSRAEDGRLLFTASSVGRQGRAYWGGYGVSKFAVEGLMQTLADEFVAMKFDVKAFIRELALSQTYQRSFEMPANLSEHVAIARKQLPVAEAAAKQQLAVAVAAEKAVDELLPKVGESKKTVTAATAELTKANAAMTAVQTAATTATKAQANVVQMLAPKQQIAKSLTEAVEKIQAALKTLPDDKELAAVAAKFVAKAKLTTTEVAALTKTLAERKTANAAAQQKLAAAQKLAAKSSGAVDAAKKQLAALTAQHTAAAAALATATRDLDATDKQESHTRLLTSYGDAQAKLAATNATIGKTSAALAAMHAGLNQLVAKMAKSQADLPVMQKANAAAVAALTKANADFVGKPDIAKLLTESVAKAEAAGQKLPNDTELAAAVGKLKQRSQKLNQEIIEYRKAITSRTAERKAAADKLAALTQSIATATAATADMKKQAVALETQRKQVAAKVEAEQATADSAFDSLTDQWSTHFAVTPIEALTPEQIAWSVLQSTGQYDRQHAASAAEINKKTPMTEADLKDAAKVAARDAAIEAATVIKLQGNVNQFVKLFGAGAGQPQHEFFATVDQSLFFANGGQVRGWLSPGGGNLTDRLIKTEDPKAVAEELYLSLLTRQPTAEETADVAAYLIAKKDKKNEAVQELAWALLTSTEFRFNH